MESRILARANAKLKLDRLVIQKGNFVGAKSKSAITEKDLEELLNESPMLAGHLADDITDDQLFSWENVVEEIEIENESEAEEDEE